MNEINLAIIGFGFMGKVYNYASKVLNDFYPDTPKVSIESTLISKNTDPILLKNRYGFQNITTDINDLITNKNIDAVYVASPNNFHFEHSSTFIKEGKHILCEKPMTVNIEEAIELNKMAQSKSEIVTNMVFEYRFIPAISKMKNIIDSGHLGRLLQFRISYLHGSYAEKRKETWRLKPPTGGALIDLGPHVIDLVAFLVGPIKSLKSKLVTKMKDRQVDDIAWALCNTINDVDGSIEVSRLSTGCTDDLRIEIHGEKGSLRWNLENLNFFEKIKKNDEQSGFKNIPYFNNPIDGSDFPPIKVTNGWLMAHVRCLHNFVKNISDPTFSDSRTATFNHGLDVQRIINKMKSV